MNHNHHHDDNLRSALRHLPQAPANSEFAGRLVRIAVLTPQRGRELVMEAPSSPLRFAWALVGFTVGIALIFLCLMPLQSRFDSMQSEHLTVSFVSMTFDPLETAAKQIYEVAPTDGRSP